jgi:hypothetical protein
MVSKLMPEGDERSMVQSCRTGPDHKLLMKLALFVFFVWVAALDGQVVRHRHDASMSALQERLQDSQRLAQNNGFVIAGEVSRNDEVHRKRCSSGGEHEVAYRVLEMLWNYADSLTKPGDEVRKGFTDCRQTPLPPPFTAGTKVIVYCEAPRAGVGDVCDFPVLFSDDRLKTVQSWIEDLRQREGDPVLLQIHRRMRDSLELAPTRPMLLLGQVSWVQPQQKYFIGSIPMLPMMRVSVSRLLWGYYKDSEVRAVCPSRDCSSVAVGAKAIAYCASSDPYQGPPAWCPLAAANYTDENLRRVEAWAAQARERQRDLIVDKIRTYLEKPRSGPRSEPRVYRGYAESVGKADNGIPLVHFIDTTGRYKNPLNLLFHLPYYTRAPLALETGKRMITFCVQKDDVCYIGEEALGIIEDSDQTFREIEKLMSGESD